MTYELTCANCGSKTIRETKPRSPFCSVVCRETADVVRYRRSVLRRAVEDPSLLEDEEIQAAVEIMMAHVLSGGYDANAHAIPRATRALVLKRDQGKCVLCGKPGEEIDHIDGPSPDPANLRLLCKECHWEKTSGHLESIPEGSPKRDEANAIDARVYAPEPSRPCDAAEWATTWRQELKKLITTT